MIMVTGAAGFIGQNLVKAMAKAPWHGNVSTFDPKYTVNKDPLSALGPFQLGPAIEAIIHLGAISDTTCEDFDALRKTNLILPLRLSDFCVKKRIPFIYASSASVYGNGNGPLNHYAHSKRDFDQVMIAAGGESIGRWYGLRLFNVYGPGEAAKGRQASMVHQVIEAFRDGERPRIWLPHAKRDFIYVGDVVRTILWFLKERPASGIYDVGTGVARSFEEVVDVVEDVMGVSNGYVEVPIPPELKPRYQTYTRARVKELFMLMGPQPFLALEDGVREMLRAR